MKAFCTCGFATEYSLTRPRFCGGCGEPFDKTFKRTIASTTSNTPVYHPQSVPVAPSLPPQYSRPDYTQQDESILHLDPSMIIAEEKPEKLTIGSLRDMDFESFARREEKVETSDSEIKSVLGGAAAKKKALFEQMMLNAPQPASVSPAKPRRRKSR